MKRIKINYKNCIGCRMCELACSLQHLKDTVQPSKSRIRIFGHNNHYFPVIAGPYAKVACKSRQIISVDDQEYDGCIFCRASCPIKPVFKDPDTEKPIKCDLCGGDPQCASVCINDALVLVED